MQNSEFGIQSESEAGRWIGSEWWGVAGRRNLICFFLENRAACFVLVAPLEGVAYKTAAACLRGLGRTPPS